MDMLNTDQTQPELSLVVPCYNEEEAIPNTIPHLVAAFRNAGYRIELIAVDNGSADATGAIILELAAHDPWIVHHRVEKNQGYGNGVLQGITRATAPWLGIIPADGQVDPQDVVQLFEAVSATNGRVVGKVRRRFRMDGLTRKLVSIAYNGFVRLLWPRLQSIDVNGSPKILLRQAVAAMNLESRGWLLDPEILVKAHYQGLRVLEYNVFARMRGTGISHVRAETCVEFFSRLLAAKITRRWRRQITPGVTLDPPPRRRPRNATGDSPASGPSFPGHPSHVRR